MRKLHSQFIFDDWAFLNQVDDLGFYCDNCGAPLPESYIKPVGDDSGSTYFDRMSYDTIKFPEADKGWEDVTVSLTIRRNMGATLRELCPACRVAWLKKYLAEEERKLLPGNRP